MEPADEIDVEGHRATSMPCDSGGDGEGVVRVLRTLTESSRTAASSLRQCHPDVVLMDVRMPTVDGVTATKQLHAEAPMTPILALTTFDDDEALAGMLRAGAAGFVLTGVPAEELQRAVRVVADGGAWLDPAVTRRILDVYRAAPVTSAEPDRGNALTRLTDREREVLTLIGAGHTNAEIARELFVGEGTVKRHINHALSKLDLRDCP